MTNTSAPAHAQKRDDRPYPRQLAAARHHAAARVISQIGQDGAIRDRCASRVLESALVLTLLRRTRSHSDVQNRISGYLTGVRPAANSLDGAVMTAVLTPRSTCVPDPLSWLNEFDHFTAARKRLTFGVILAILRNQEGSVDAIERLPDPRHFHYGGQAPWVDLTLCALKILSGYACGRPHLISADDSAFLIQQLESGSRCAIWEQYLLSHALALLALREIAPTSPLLNHGIDALVRAQNADGGFPFITGLEIFCTAIAGLALADGTHRDLLARMADYLVAHQEPDGGWAFAEDVKQTDVDDTAYCLQFLRVAAPRRHTTAIETAERFLVGIANPDGGMPTFRHGHPSESAMTAGALESLAPSWHRYPAECAAATEFLINAQQEDGTFECSWSLCETNAVFRAVSAFRCVPSQFRGTRLDQAIGRSIRYLRDNQNPDGGWGQLPGDVSDPTSTSYALLALDPHEHQQMVHLGSQYLLAEQRYDGGFISPPDLAAPRPLPYEVPVTVDINALWALHRCSAPVFT